MRGTRPSNTAQYVAVVRTVLDRKGAIDDPVAGTLLTPAMSGLAAVLSTSAFRARTNSGVFAALAARTLFFDDEVTAALDGGIHQLVIVGAGYDSRAWRLSRPGVRFFEVDHPATPAGT